MKRSLTLCCIGFGVAGTIGLVGCGGGSAPAPPATFTLSAAPASASVGQGGIATTTITVTGQNGFSGSVSLSASGLPSGVTAAFNPTSTSTTSVLTLTASNSAPTGSAAVSVIGTSGALAPTTPISLTVAAPSLTVTLSPVRAAVAATTQTQQFTPSVTGNLGNNTVTWSVDSIPGGNTTIGTISSGGLYTPPATGGMHTVTATSVALPTSSASASIAVTDLAGVFTFHNDLSRDGANLQEYALTPTTVIGATFGKLFSCAVDGATFAQPLWVPGVAIGGAVHNVLFVATQHDSLYAFDADANPCVALWHVNLIDSMHGGTAGETPVVWNDVGYCSGDVYPEVGVTGTPVIDPATDTIYVVSASEIVGSQSRGCAGNSNGAFFHRLHAIDLLTGSEKVNPPVTIAASLPGTGDGSSGGMVSFASQYEHNRPGLVLSGGNVYAAFSAHEDAMPYHGWLIGYNDSTLQQVSVFNTTPNGLGGADGGIWGGGGAPAVDVGGDIYAATGNGIYDESSLPPANDYADSTLRLHPLAGNTTTPNGVNLSVAGWFTPYDQASLQHTTQTSVRELLCCFRTRLRPACRLICWLTWGKRGPFI